MSFLVSLLDSFIVSALLCFGFQRPQCFFSHLNIAEKIWVWNCRESKAVVPSLNCTPAQTVELLKQMQLLEPNSGSTEAEPSGMGLGSIKTRPVCHPDAFLQSLFFFLHQVFSHLEKTWDEMVRIHKLMFLKTFCRIQGLSKSDTVTWIFLVTFRSPKSCHKFILLNRDSLCELWARYCLFCLSFLILKMRIVMVTGLLDGRIKD